MSKAVDIKCICNRKLLSEVAADINTKETHISLREIKTNYKCCTKCEMCVPYLKQLLVIPNNL